MAMRAGWRRRPLLVGLFLPALGLMRDAAGQSLSATPTCDDDPTPRQTEGPYFTPRSPERASLLEAGIAGERMILEGFVLDTACRPLAGALVDLWQADGQGRYDNTGYRLRGHQRADAAGRFRFETVRPGVYPGRTRHFHVKVQGPGAPLLTTQVYLPGEPANGRDRLFDPALLARLGGEAGWTIARFDFVLST